MNDQQEIQLYNHTTILEIKASVDAMHPKT